MADGNNATERRWGRCHWWHPGSRQPRPRFPVLLFTGRHVISSRFPRDGGLLCYDVVLIVPESACHVPRCQTFSSWRWQDLGTAKRLQATMNRHVIKYG
ncbi:hypothetical protein IMZ48_36745 [Candidatus Bathyarchaeota archaeon]|nr:hypothetical protein [Candidatus Bathyarchaeota archaeon]